MIIELTENQKKKNELEKLQTEQNLIRSQGITSSILQEQAILKWNGVLPFTVLTDGKTIFNIPIK